MQAINLNENMWKQVFNFINKVNSCTSLEEYYSQVLATLKTYIPCDSAHLISYDQQQQISDITAINIQQKTINNYRENFQELDPIKKQYFNQPRAVKSTLLFDYNQWTRTRYFENFLAINDFYYLCGIDIHGRQQILITISLIRCQNNSDFTAPELLFLNRISPGLSNHILLLKKLSPARLNRASFTTNTKNFRFTTREKEIARLTAAGLSNREISENLYISINTVKKHLQNIYSKTEVKNKRALMAKLYEF